MKLAKALALSAGAIGLSGQAFAADAIIAEPEPVEYVRVCDAYGAGFFYIPGTETCLRISGYVRYTIGATTDSGDATVDTPNWLGFDPDEWNKGVRARVNFDARSETEWGTLRSFIRFQSSETNFIGDQPVELDLAYIQLGGFAVGYVQSAWAGTFNGGDSNDGTFTDDGLDYGDQYRQAIQYNFGGGDGFFATISLENDPSGGVAAAANYIPDVVGKVGYAADWGTLHAILGYDETLLDTGGLTDDDAIAVRVGGHFKLGERAAFKLHGFYNDDETGNNVYWSTSEWSVQAALGYQFTDTVFASIGGQYWSDLTPTGLGLAGPFVPGTDAFSIDGGVVWEPVDNLEIRAEGNYIKADGYDGTFGGFVWFLRAF